MLLSVRVIRVPDIVREKAASAGDVGADWVEQLPNLVAALEQQWSVRIGRPLPGGTAAFVAQALTASGSKAVVKMAVPDPDFQRQVATLTRARGRGYVRLLAQDLARHAVLLEALGPSLNQVDLRPEVQLSRLCEVLRQAWAVPRAPEPQADVTVDKARGLYELVAARWEQLGRPCAEEAVALALRYAERRSAAFDPERCVVVHGDAAPPNCLQVLGSRPGAEAGYVFVDPDGFVGDPAYDLGVALRDWCPQLLAGDATLLAREYCRLLATGSGLDETPIWEWGFLERVSTGLYALSLGAERLEFPLLRSAEAICRRPGGE